MSLLVSDEVKQKRLDLCQVCPHRRENIPGYQEKHENSKAITPWSIEKDKCNLCGCYMPVKAKMQKYPTGQLVSCPAKKW